MHLEAFFPAQPRKRTLIGLTPLIDVVFILLLFFLLASSFLEWRTIQLNIPATKEKTVGDSSGLVLIRLATNGVIDINGKAIAIDQLEGRLQQLFIRRPDQKVLVRSAAGVPLQPVVNVLDVIRQAGGTNVSLTH